MKRMSVCLNSMKSRCFILFASLSLLLATTSCNNDKLEFNDPQTPKQYTKAELIEQALDRMPKTRANGDIPIVMITKGKTVTMMVEPNKGKQLRVYWGEGEEESELISGFEIIGHTYHDNKPSHAIFFEGKPDAIKELWADQNDLIFLDIARNRGLTHLSCSNNELDMLDLTGCNALKTLIASVNHLSSIELSHLKYLEDLLLDYNDLTSVDISDHLQLQSLNLGYNSKLKHLKLSNLPSLTGLYLGNLSIETFNDEPVTDSTFSFADFRQLRDLELIYTTFITSLDISNNPYLEILNINTSHIKKLNMSNGAIAYVFAEKSLLTDLMYDPDRILNLRDFRITGTPFELSGSPLNLFLTSGLPFRSSEEPGKLYVSRDGQEKIAPLIPYLKIKNWEVINPL